MLVREAIDKTGNVIFTRRKGVTAGFKNSLMRVGHPRAIAAGPVLPVQHIGAFQSVLNSEKRVMEDGLFCATDDAPLDPAPHIFNVTAALAAVAAGALPEGIENDRPEEKADDGSDKHLELHPECKRKAEIITTDKKLSVIISTHNEGREVLLTCQDVLDHAGCPVEIILIDEASNDGSCDNLPEGVKVIRNEKRTGVAPARNQGVEHATGDAFMFLDAHMRVAPGVPARMMLAALEKQALIVPGVAPLYSSSRGGIWICKWQFKGGRLRSKWHSSCKNEFEVTDCFVAPGWVVTREEWNKMGPWARSLDQWGSTEVYKSLQASFAGVPMYAMRDAVVWHRFRNRFPYSVKTAGIFKNAYTAARIIFGKEVFNEVFLPAMKSEHWGEHIEKQLSSDTIKADCEDFDKRRVRDPREFLSTFFPKGLLPEAVPPNAPETPKPEKPPRPGGSFFEADVCAERRMCRQCRLDPGFQLAVLDAFDEPKSDTSSFECPHGITKDSLPEPKLPPIGEQVQNFAEAVARTAKRLAEGKKVVASPEKRDERIKICEACDQLVGTRCAKCGCSTPAKVALEGEKCPMDCW
jgi:glycosyltransferase involved in cell wall biosynthesis